MSHDSTTEDDLRKYKAVALGDELLARLEGVADGTWTKLDRDEIRFEAFLGQQHPAILSPELLAALESVIAGVPFAVDEKIVMFPKGGQSPVRTRRPMWAAAAAVAMIGAVSALLLPSPARKSQVAGQTGPAVGKMTAEASKSMVPASFQRGVSEVHDEGVVWKSGSQPHSVVRVVYKDRIILKDANGRTFEVEQPRVEYMMVPAKTD